MKKLILVIVISICFSCKNKEEVKVLGNELIIAEKIANANGFQNWKNISQIEFTFNVDKDSSHFERSWIWKTKTGNVTLISGKDTISFNRKSVDSLSIKADQGFINDKFWLLAPFQLVWDKTSKISEPLKETSPISKIPLNKITQTYPNDGGYTPGDAYDFYYDDDFIIREWVFRKGNSKKPSLITTWEDYETFNGLTIAKTHKKLEENWTLYFTGVAVEAN